MFHDEQILAHSIRAAVSRSLIISPAIISTTLVHVPLAFLIPLVNKEHCCDT